MSLTTALTVLFVGLKLTGYVDWSWYTVFAPVLIWCIIFTALIVFTTIARECGGR